MVEKKCYDCPTTSGSHIWELLWTRRMQFWKSCHKFFAQSEKFSRKMRKHFFLKNNSSPKMFSGHAEFSTDNADVLGPKS